MNRITLLCVAVFFLFNTNSQGQNEIELQRVYSLEEIINTAREQSIASKRAETIRENRFWQFQTYRSNYKPQLQLDGTFPSYNRSFSDVTQPDGTIQFRAVQYNNSDISLSIEQPIAATGARIFLNSGINRFDNFLETDDLTRYHQYSGNPLEIGLVQPIFQYNQLKWDKRIEPLRFQESQREYFQNLEEISLFATQRFFDLMLAQITLEIAEKNIANNDTIFKIAQGRYNLGKIAENELLQLELQLMNSRQQGAEAKLDIETRTLRLKTYVGLPEASELALLLPEEIPAFDVDEDVALMHAKANRAEIIGFERQMIEANSEIARAKGETGPRADLFARFGLTNNTGVDGSLSDIYRDPKDQQIVNLGFSIPILDWGRRKSRVKTAEANQKLVEYQVEQDIITFDEEVLTLVRQFEMLKEQVNITKVADEIAQKRYDITKSRYLIGKIDITNMNIALTEKDQAKRNYIQSLRDFWTAYFNLRFLTLFDFERGFQIISEEI